MNPLLSLLLMHAMQGGGMQGNPASGAPIGPLSGSGMGGFGGGSFMSAGSGGFNPMSLLFSPLGPMLMQTMFGGQQGGDQQKKPETPKAPAAAGRTTAPTAKKTASPTGGGQPSWQGFFGSLGSAQNPNTGGFSQRMRPTEFLFPGIASTGQDLGGLYGPGPLGLSRLPA